MAGTTRVTAADLKGVMSALAKQFARIKSKSKIGRKATRDDLTRLIAFSIENQSLNITAQKFPMFTFNQIFQLYSTISRDDRERLLKLRLIQVHQKYPRPSQYRNPEQLRKMAEIATDPSNR